MAKVVIDTSALITLLANRKTIWFLKNEFALKHQIITSPYLIAELERVLKNKLKLSKSKVKSISSLYQSLSTVKQVGEIKRLTRDENDDPILSLALEQKAEYLITFDKDFLVLNGIYSLKIIKPDNLDSL